MPYVPPTREEILQRVKADMRTELGVDPLHGTPEYAFARAIMAQSKGQYSFLQYIFRQVFPDTADAFYFWRFAGFFAITQKPATPWQGTVTLTGTDLTPIPAGTEIARNDGQLYTTDALEAIDGTSTTVACTASAGGTTGNNEVGQKLVLSSPIAGIDPTCTVAATTNAGEDIENQTDGLERLLQRLATPPSGGGPGDYVRWALQVSGVTRAWEFANLEAPNSVSIAFVRDNDGTGSDIIPDADERAEVLAYLATVAPITVDVKIITLVAQSVAFNIGDLEDDTPETRASIEANIDDLFVREAEPGGTMALSRVDAAISAADGETSHTLVAPAAPLVSTTAQILIRGSMTYS